MNIVKREALEGEAGVEKLTDDLGNTHFSRTPKKALNPFMKATLLQILKRDGVQIKKIFYPGSTEYHILDAKGKELFMYDNAWDYGYYYIDVPSSDSKKTIRIAEMEWRENDMYTNPAQQAIFDVFQAITERDAELKRIEEGRNNLNAEEMAALKALGLDR